MISRLLLILGLLLPVSSFADLNKELNRFYKRIGGHANVNSGEIYNGQKAGYMTGGGLSVRSRIMNPDLLNINLPKFDAGCGGIDLHMGGFSFINKDQLVDTLKSIAGDSIGYAFMLGMETMSPQIASTMKDLQSKMQQINGMSINSCETAAQLVGSVWPKEALASQHICRTTSAARGTSFDMVNSRHKCSQSGGFSTEEQERGNQSEYQDMVGSEYNIAWKVIRKHSFLRSNSELAELFMTLTGTIVSKYDGDEKQIDHIASKMDDEEFIGKMLRGGSLKVYYCDENEKCLNLSEKNTQVLSGNSWEGKVKTKLKSIQDKIFKDTELNAEEIEMLSTSRLPLYRIINVMSAYNYNTIDLVKLSNMVALDILHQYIREVIQLSREGASQLKEAQAFDSKITDFLKNLDRLEEKLVKKEERNHRLFEKETTLFRQIDFLEEKLHSKINF